MYPYVNCKQKIDPELINMLRNLYSIEPKAELYFTNTTVLKEGIYLNFSVQINNEGLIDAKSIFLEIYADDKKVDSFDLKDMEFGAGENFWVNNLKLPSLKIETIKMRIISETPEYNYENNIIEVGV
jgi:hypothetical protein